MKLIIAGPEQPKEPEVRLALLPRTAIAENGILVGGADNSVTLCAVNEKGECRKQGRILALIPTAEGFYIRKINDPNIPGLEMSGQYAAIK